MTPTTEGPLTGRVALVPGGTGALGQAVVLALAEAGASVTVSFRDPAGTEALRAALPSRLHARLRTVPADVTDPREVARLVAEAAPAGRLDVLVNAVGGFAGGTLLETDEATWSRMLDLNLRSAYLCCRASLPPMIESGGGRIVNIASRSVVPPAGGFTAYTVAKAGVIALTQALAHEVRGQRVTVNAVLPGTMDTPANRRAMPGADRTQWISTAQVARAVRFLVGSEAGEITGSLLAI